MVDGPRKPVGTSIVSDITGSSKKRDAAPSEGPSAELLVEELKADGTTAVRVPEVGDGTGIEEEEGGRSDADSRLELSRTLLGGGAYETVLVILQDLAATELEEAFDHVDVVTKRADTATVVVDGGLAPLK
jgi:hypothetical protein